MYGPAWRSRVAVGALMPDEFRFRCRSEDYSKMRWRLTFDVKARSLNFPLLGLFGEVGSLLAEVKKKQRDPISYRGYAAAVTEELGDVLWYLNLVAARGGFSFAKSSRTSHMMATTGSRSRASQSLSKRCSRQS